mgnify:CR=1 FL=1
MMTLDPLVHDTFNTPLGQTGEHEGHSVIRTENGGYWYADDVSGDDHVAEAHAEIVRRVNLFPKLIEAVKLMLASASPRPSENPLMWAAWGDARRVLDKANKD